MTNTQNSMTKIFNYFMASLFFSFSKFLWNLPKFYSRKDKILVTERLTRDNSNKTLFSLYGASLYSERRSEQDMIHCITMAEIYIHDKRFENAEEILREAIKMAHDFNDIRAIVYAYELQSGVLMITDRIDESENCLNEAISVLSKNGLSDDENLIVKLKLKLSRLYQKKGDDEVADETYRQCLIAQKQSVTYKDDNETKMLLAMILYCYGKFLLKKEKFKEAKNFLDDCYNVCRKWMLINPYQMINLLFSLGEISHILGEFDNELDYYGDALILGNFYSKEDALYEKLYKELKKRISKTYPNFNYAK